MTQTTATYISTIDFDEEGTEFLTIETIPGSLNFNVKKSYKQVYGNNGEFNIVDQWEFEVPYELFDYLRAEVFNQPELWEPLMNAVVANTVIRPA